MRKIRSKPIPVVDLKDAAKGRKQEIEIKLRAGRGHEPGKTDAARQENDADRKLACVNGVGNSALRLLIERQAERERSRIKPRKIWEIHRSHAREHAVGAEIEHLAEFENGLDIPFSPFAVDRRVEGKRQAMHADDHQDGKNAPRQEIRQDTGEGRHQRKSLGRSKVHVAYSL